jgi:amidase
MELQPSRRAVMAGIGAAVAVAASGARSQGTSGQEDAYRTAGDLAKALADRKISSRELVDAAIARIDKLDPKINAIVVRDFDRARAAAKAADEAIAKGERRPLLGLPMTVKENFAVAGLSTTRGDPRHKNWKAEVDGLAVERLKAAGAVILGKTNVPLNMADFQSYNDVYGATKNPWDLSRTPGGSSGGAAAVLAAGFVPLELGSDIGGSLRVPAHFCGVYAHKPTLDLIPLRNSGPPDVSAFPLRGDLAVIGPMARSAADLALELDVLAGPDELAEGVGYKLALPPSRHDKLADFRVLVIEEHPLCPTSATVRDALTGLADRLAKTGCKVVRSTPKLPDLARTSRIYNELLAAVYTLDLSSQDRARIDAAARVLSPEDQSLAAYRLRGISVAHPEWIRASRVRARLRGHWFNLFEEVDLILCPVTSTPAFPHDHSPKFGRQIEVDGSKIPYDDQLAWAGIATLNGLPATTAPIGRSETGLPIGVQIVGGYLQDRTTIAFAGLIEREFGGFSPPPNFA